MGYKCMYCGKNVEPGVRFMKAFPLNDEKLLKSWLKNVQLCANYMPLKTWKLCSDHFTKDLIQFGEKTLKPGSIPTLFGKRIWKFCVCCGIHQYHASRPSFYSFPEHNAVLLPMWLKSVASNGIRASKSSLVCSNHFEDNCFKNNQRRNGRLKHSAVPTVFQPQFHVKHEKRPSESEKTTCMPRLKYFRDSTLSESSVQLSRKLSNVPVYKAGPSTNNNGITQNYSFKRDGTLPQTLHYDHNYVTSPGKLKRELLKEQEKNKKLANLNRIRQQRISRLVKRIRILKDIISKLKKNQRENSLDNFFECYS